MRKLLFIISFIIAVACYSQQATAYNQYNKRPSEKDGRTYVTANTYTQTTTQSIYTVTAGKTLYVTSMMIDFYNTNTGSYGSLSISDNTTVLIPMLISPAVNGQNTPMNGGDMLNFPEPLRFTNKFTVTINTGTIIYSVSFIGYEE